MKCEPSNPELYTQMIGMHVKENGRDTDGVGAAALPLKSPAIHSLPVNQTRPAQTLYGGADT